MATLITNVTGEFPGGHRAATAANYIGGMGIHQDQVHDEYIERFGMGRLNDFMHSKMAYVPVSGDTFSNWQAGGRVHNAIVAKPKTTSAPTSGKTQHTFTVNADYLASISGVAAASTPYVRVGDVVMTRFGQMATVTAVSGADFTVKPYAAAWSFPSGITTSTDLTFIVVTREVGKRSTTPTQGINPLPWEWTGTIAIRDDAQVYDGDALNQKLWFQVKNEQTGETGFFWNIKAFGDTYIRFVNHDELAHFFAVPADAAGGAAEEGLKGVKGLKYSIEQYGHTMDLNGAKPTLEIMRRITRKMDAYGGARENMLCGGNIFLDGIDDMIAGNTAMAIGGQNFGTFVNGQGQIEFNFDGFKLNKYKFAKMEYEPFNDPGLFGAPGFNEIYQRSAFVMPLESTVNPQDGTTVTSGRIRYSAGTYDRRREIWPSGGANGVYTHNTDSFEINYRSHTGPEWFALNRWFYIQG